MSEIEIVKPDIKWTTWGMYPAEQLEADVSIITEAHVRQNFKSAGVLPVCSDSARVLLGGHRIENDLVLWGPFAGSKETGEQPEDVARREAFEEAGLVNLDLKPATVLINGSKRNGEPSIGVVFPVVVDRQKIDSLAIPNAEIQEVRWFYHDSIMELMDIFNPAYQLWGGVYTWSLLRTWMDASIVRRGESYSPEVVCQKMHTAILVDGFWDNSSNPYHRIKAK